MDTHDRTLIILAAALALGGISFVLAPVTLYWIPIGLGAVALGIGIGVNVGGTIEPIEWVVLALAMASIVVGLLAYADGPDTITETLLRSP